MSLPSAIRCLQFISHRKEGKVMHNSFDNSLDIPQSFDVGMLPRNLNERRHGFQCPWNIYQIITLVFYISTVFTTCFVIIPAYWSLESQNKSLIQISIVISQIQSYYSIACAFVLFFGVSVAVLVMAIITTTSNPLDPLVLKQRFLRYHKIAYDAYNLKDGKPLELYCQVCKAYVGDNTKHCAQCNRCCSEFDHHCQWLNNCIGGQNYQDFRSLTGVFLLFCFLNIVYTVILIPLGVLFQENEHISRPGQYLLWGQSVASVLTFLVDAHLVAFHVWINNLGISTFDYIGYKITLKEKKADLQKKAITQDEFDQWRHNALKRPEKRKSKIVTRVAHEIQPDGEISKSFVTHKANVSRKIQRELSASKQAESQEEEELSPMHHLNFIRIIHENEESVGQLQQEAPTMSMAQEHSSFQGNTSEHNTFTPSRNKTSKIETTKGSDLFSKSQRFSAIKNLEIENEQEDALSNRQKLQLE